MEVMEAVNHFIVGAAGQPWVYLLLLALCTIDGFFPPVPSESVVVALAAVAMSAGVPNLWILMLLSAVGAIAGDNIAYAIGRRIGTSRFRWMRRRRVAKSFAWARRELDKRGALLILTARYIPVGRVAVNMTAGATGYPRHRFLLFTVVAGVSWSLYSVGIGVLAGTWIKDHPLLGAGLAVLLALVLGFVLDKIIYRLAQRRDARRKAADEPVRLRREQTGGRHPDPEDARRAG